MSVEAADTMTPQAVAEYAVWYARKVKGPAATVAAALLEEFPWLREPLEADSLAGTLDGDTLRAAIREACDLTNPRLSEVDWDAVAAALRGVPA